MTNWLTTYEAAEKYGLTGGYLRRLMRMNKLKGREARVTKTRTMWFIDESSLQKYIKSPRTRGRPAKK